MSYGGTFVADGPVRVATIPVGYADGYPRGLSNKGWVLIRGKKARILGRVCMDQFMADVTDIPDVEPGDEVTLIGKRRRRNVSPWRNSAICRDVFSYEFACCISKRVSAGFT